MLLSMNYKNIVMLSMNIKYKIQYHLIFLAALIFILCTHKWYCFSVLVGLSFKSIHSRIWSTRLSQIEKITVYIIVIFIVVKRKTWI